MTLRPIQAKTILRRHPGIDSWFISWGGMNLYRGCAHDCVYCDGRSEKYRVEGDFAHDIQVKQNALTLLEKELDPARRRKPFPGGFLMLGGGVGDLYQPHEQKLGLTREVLTLAQRFHHPVHVLSKSILVERDKDILQEIGKSTAVLVRFSFSSTNDTLAAQVEPAVPPPSKRLELMARFNAQGIPCGAFLMPVLPGLSDSPSQLRRSIQDLKAAGCRYIIFSGLTLKPGRQKDHYLSFLQRQHPHLMPSIPRLYPPSPWGGPDKKYITQVNHLFFTLAGQAEIPRRIPLPLFKAITNPSERALIALQQLADLADMTGTRHPFRSQLQLLSGLPKPFTCPEGNILECLHLHPEVKNIIQEIMMGKVPLVYKNWLGGLGQ